MKATKHNKKITS